MISRHNNPDQKISKTWIHGIRAKPAAMQAAIQAPRAELQAMMAAGIPTPSSHCTEREACVKKESVIIINTSHRLDLRWPNTSNRNQIPQIDTLNRQIKPCVKQRCRKKQQFNLPAPA